VKEVRLKIPRSLLLRGDRELKRRALFLPLSLVQESGELVTGALQLAGEDVV
jgi:hypothetical protein